MRDEATRQFGVFSGWVCLDSIEQVVARVTFVIDRNNNGLVFDFFFGIGVLSVFNFALS